MFNFVKIILHIIAWKLFNQYFQEILTKCFIYFYEQYRSQTTSYMPSVIFKGIKYTLNIPLPGAFTVLIIHISNIFTTLSTITKSLINGLANVRLFSKLYLCQKQSYFNFKASSSCHTSQVQLFFFFFSHKIKTYLRNALLLF